MSSNGSSTSTSPYFRFGYDFDTKHTKDQLLDIMDEYEIAYESGNKPRLLYQVEKWFADQREAMDRHPTEHLRPTFRAHVWRVAQLRQILTFHDIPYPPRPTKQELIDIFEDSHEDILAYHDIAPAACAEPDPDVDVDLTASMSSTSIHGRARGTPQPSNRNAVPASNRRQATRSSTQARVSSPAPTPSRNIARTTPTPKATTTATRPSVRFGTPSRLGSNAPTNINTGGQMFHAGTKREKAPTTPTQDASPVCPASEPDEEIQNEMAQVLLGRFGGDTDKIAALLSALTNQLPKQN